MASTTSAHTAGFAHKQQARRTLSRIVPAIPHRLSRAPPPSARPITPEESHKGAVSQSEPQPEQQQPEALPAGEKQPAKQSAGQPVAALNGPLTPDSRTSGADKSEPDAPPLAHSPPTSPDDQGEDSTQVQDTNASDHPNNTPDDDALATRPGTKPPIDRVRRKLNIPAQLPPPFYPSNHADTPTPPVESADTSHTPYHRHQLSAGAVVFQSANASPAAPATPQESDHDLLRQQQTSSRPPPGFAPPQYPQFIPTHSQHPSDAGAPWVPPPYSAAQPEHIYENVDDFRSPPFSNGLVTQVNPYDGQLPAVDTTFATNGTGTSQSQSPSKTQFAEPRPNSEYGGEEHRAMQYQNGTAHPAERLEESPFELASYLSTQFGNPEFADFVLQIRSPESALVSIPVHGIVVVRSPVIAEAVRRSPAPTHRSRDARRLIDVMALDPYATRESLEEAVKVLYGAPLLSAQSFLYGLGPYMYESNSMSPTNEARRRMQQVLSYIAAAKTLQIPSMQARGVEIARLLLRWDTVDQVLRYGLQASSARIETVDAEDLFIATLLNYAVEHMAYTFPVDFRLYTIAPEFQDVPRLPVLLETRPPTHNPRLSKIRFGDAPPEDDLTPTHVDRVLSTILLSLPSPVLERLFNHRATANQIGWTGAAKLLGDVVVERENRRQKALRGALKPAQDGLVPAALLENMYTEEHVESSAVHPSGYRLATKRTAAET